MIAPMRLPLLILLLLPGILAAQAAGMTCTDVRTVLT